MQKPGITSWWPWLWMRRFDAPELSAEGGRGRQSHFMQMCEDGWCVQNSQNSSHLKHHRNTLHNEILYFHFCNVWHFLKLNMLLHGSVCSKRIQNHTLHAFLKFVSLLHRTSMLFKNYIYQMYRLIKIVFGLKLQYFHSHSYYLKSLNV